MKLRDRGKRISGNCSIKQEDPKPVLTSAESSTTSIRTDTNTDSVTIKKEDMREDKRLLRQQGEFIKRDHYYQCDVCKMKMTDIKSVLEHRHSIHNIADRSGNRSIKHIDMEPDIHDPNLYCKSCEKGFRNANVYRIHLRHTHFMALKPMPRWKAPRKDIAPNPDDPNLYCRACERIYSKKHAYRKHCRNVHVMKSVKFANQSSTSSSRIDSYCQACDRRFSSIESYRLHLFAIHKVDWRLLQQNQKDVLPDVNDPNFYCRSCNKRMASDRNFKQHLMRVHSIFRAAPPKKNGFDPNVNDPNNHCRACQKTYSSKGTYRRHLRTVHQMTLSSLRVNLTTTDLPDPFNPDHYCGVCKKTYASLSTYRKHCKRVHLMVLSRFIIVNPNAKLNINDPDFHCAQCERTLDTKSSFKRHLRIIHGV
ncbi:hypothetical protein MBANPS3_000961 [Mucor bainieri]